MEFKEELLEVLINHISRGITPKYIEDVNKGILVLNQKCIRDFKINYKDCRIHNIERKLSENKIIEKYDILINSTGVGTAGRVAQKLDENICTLDSHVTLIKPNSKKIYPLYLGYALKAQQKLIENFAEGSTGQTEISCNRLKKEIIIKYPEKYEIQEKIANILLKIDSKIELNNQINDNLQELCNSTFVQWFCNYNYPNFDGILKETDYGSIPKTWNIGKFDDLVDFSNGYGFKSTELLDKAETNTYRVFKQGNIDLNGGIREDKTKSWFYKDKAIGLEKYILKKGDILMCMTDMKNSTSPLLGHTAVMNKDNEYIVNQRVGLIRCKKEIVDFPYIYTMTNLEFFLQQIRSRANSGVQVNLSTTGICETTIIIPTKDILKRYDDFARPLYEKMFLNLKENRALEQLRDTLLPKLMNGEIDLENIEI